MPQIELRYFGVSAFEITSEKGVKVLIDPCITGFGGHKFSSLGLDALDGVDLILVSHGAADHLGDTEALAKQTGCRVMAMVDVLTYLNKKGVDPKQLTNTIWGLQHEYKGLKIRFVESHHASWLQYEDGTTTSYIAQGFMIWTESGLCIYHPGDTSIFSDIKLFGELYRPQIGLLPVGLPVDGLGGHELSAREAALVTKWMGLKLVVPMHYSLGSKDPETFSSAVNRESPDTKVVIMKVGERIVYEFSLPLEQESLLG